MDMAAGRIPIIIEIKRSAYEPDHPPDAIEKQILGLVAQKNAVEEVLITSFEWQVLESLDSLKKAPAVAVLSG